METRSGSQASFAVENLSSIKRKVSVKIPAKAVKAQFDKALAEIQRTANIKGFRVGHVPLEVIKAQFGHDVRHRLYHTLVQNSFDEAVREHHFRAIGSPQIEAPEHQTGDGEHDHGVQEDRDFAYTATFEIMPEIEVKDHFGVSLTKESVEVTDKDVDQVVDNLRQSQAQLVSYADPAHVSKNGDFLDMKFVGGIVTDAGVETKENMTGSRVTELGAGGWMPGFEEQLVGMTQGQSKTFRIKFPEAGTPEAESAGEYVGKEAEFTVTVNEVKEKKLPELDEEFLKQVGYQNLEDLRTQARTYLLRKKTEDSDKKVQNELIAHLIAKNPFDVPAVLIQEQTRALVQDLAEDFKRQGYGEQAIQRTLAQDFETLGKRAENQLRAHMIFEAVAAKEKLAVTPEQVSEEVSRLAQEMNVERSEIEKYHGKNPSAARELEFRLRQELTLKFLMDKAKVKTVSPSV